MRIAGVSHDPGIPPGVAEPLDERIAEYEANPAAARTTDEVTAGILQLEQRIATSKS